MSKSSLNQRLKALETNLLRVSNIGSSRLIDKINLASTRSAIKNATVIVIDDIQNQINESEDRIWPTESFPNIAPPFNKFFMEAYCDGRIWGISPFQHGLLFQVFEDFDFLIGKTHIYPDTKWVYLITGFICNQHQLRDLKTYGVVCVSKDGKWLSDDSQLEGFALEQFALNASEDHSILAQMLPASLWALSLMNCRNVELVEHPATSSRKPKAMLKANTPSTSYKTLRIRPIDKRYEKENSGSHQKNKAFHIRRGHFKHYTKNNPRFGYDHPNNIGVFWIDSTVVGANENGTVIKNYKVLAE